MRSARATLVWAALAAAVCVPIAAGSDQRAARLAQPGLHPGRVRGDCGTGPRARSAPADWRVLAGVVSPSPAAGPSLGGRRAGRGGRHSRRGSLGPPARLTWLTPFCSHRRRRSPPSAWSRCGPSLPSRSWLHSVGGWDFGHGRGAPAHMVLAVVIVAGGLVHAMLIEGTMETVSKAVLCALVSRGDHKGHG